MATTAWMYKANQPPKFKCRSVRRCQVCGRSHAVYRKFRLCRVCFRNMANQGLIPGVKKASW
ncbi:MAG TPA: type Z 30S ribosomal protein S14 [Phycisphaerae bacterium]|nr:type Z 30S ribosomal protein S14 [Phycisphaerae bacterium]HOW70413.1 type Z 30S ribosomal protein S14 [Phycisphaerae bacterium]HRY67830.1 type Z 30S ribosomal protein S14 [Phycisphaerae bacterium]HSA25283.1 type Z 30S ribosomal protein S14 [Phycisphaerae bacterium]